METRKSLCLSHDNITPSIRVSTAAVPSSHYHGHYWQIETWIFSDDSRQKNVQRIHGTTYSNGRDEFDYNYNLKLCCRAERAHEYIVENLKSLYGQRCEVCNREIEHWQTFCACGVVVEWPEGITV